MSPLRRRRHELDPVLARLERDLLEPERVQLGVTEQLAGVGGDRTGRVVHGLRVGYRVEELLRVPVVIPAQAAEHLVPGQALATGQPHPPDRRRGSAGRRRGTCRLAAQGSKPVRTALLHHVGEFVGKQVLAGFRCRIG